MPLSRTARFKKYRQKFVELKKSKAKLFDIDSNHVQQRKSDGWSESYHAISLGSILYFY